MSYVQNMQQILSAEEQMRARRFFFEKDRMHFIVARGLLRVILSRYLDQEPSQLRFIYSRYGKPGLEIQSGEETLSFNMSHSSGLALYAITRNRKIGIDIECISENIPYEQIAERFFSRQENAVLRELPTGETRDNAFFTCWTRKEAYIKARGDGLSLPLNQFDVSLSPGEPARLLNNRQNPNEVSRWSFLEVIPSPGFVATLVVEGCGWRVAYWELLNQ
jgi:4'-phosphopantetheinyl transferase